MKPTHRKMVSFICLIFFAWSVLCVDNGLGRTPQMGYNTWNDYNCNIDQTDIFAAADAMISQGLSKLGYVYMNIDDCWALQRFPNGTIEADPSKFPSGMVHISAYVHSKGLKFGIYTDRGNLTCQRRPGSLNFETIDADTYARWGVDYLKEDSCYASQVHEEAFAEYAKMRDALNSTGRPIFFSLCGWNSWYAPKGASLGNSWRIAGDCTNWSSVLRAINTNAPLAKYAGPGGWNDPDMLIGSSKNTAFSLEPQQSRTQFGLWAIMAAPLLIGADIVKLPPFDLETYTNQEVIAVDQDELGKQGVRVAGGELAMVPNSTTCDSNPDSCWNVWGRPLSGGRAALLFLNTSPSLKNIVCDQKCFAQLGFSPSVRSVKLRDLWKHRDIGEHSLLKPLAVAIEPNGASQVFLLTPS